MLTAGRSFVLTAVATILAAGACSRSDRADLLTRNSPEGAKVLENTDETRRRRKHDRAWKFECPLSKAVVQGQSTLTLFVRSDLGYYSQAEVQPAPQTTQATGWLKHPSETVPLHP